MIKYKILTLILIFFYAEAFSKTNLEEEFNWGNLPNAHSPVFKPDTFNVINYQAKPDGITLNTSFINKAIEDCSTKGGGVVLVPPGVWLTGPVIIRSNVNLHVQRGAILSFTPDFNQYPLIEGNYEGKPSVRNQSPLSAYKAENIAVTGNGVIDGNGDFWRLISKDALTEREWKEKIKQKGVLSDDGKTWYPSEKSKLGNSIKDAGNYSGDKNMAFYESIKDFLRPTLVNFTSCNKVLLEGVTFQNSPSWCLHLLMCENLTLKNLTVRNPDYAKNGDGLDLESCKNVVVDGCTFDVGDDGICIKSGKDEAGRLRNIPTENVVVKNCTVYKAHGGFVIGSEMSGGARNIFVSDCVFIGTDRGLRFKTARGRGGVVEDIYIKNIFMKDIGNEAIFFDMYYYTKPPVKGEKIVVPEITEETPQFRNFNINNVVCQGAKKGIFIRGLPEMSVQNIKIQNAQLSSEIGVELIDAENILLKEIQLKVENEEHPLMYFENAKNIAIHSLKNDGKVPYAVKVYGKRSDKITVDNSPGIDESVLQFDGGAGPGSVRIK